MSYGLEAAAERVGQQLLGQRADEHLGPLQQRLPQRHDAVDVRAVDAAGPTRRSASAVPPSRVRQAPTASKFSSAKPERIHQLVAARAHRVRAVLLHPLAHRSAACRPLLVLLERRHVGGGGGGGVPSRFSRIHLPRTTGEVRSACDVTIRMLPLPEQPLPRFVGQRARGGTGCRRRSGCRSAWPAAR